METFLKRKALCYFTNIFVSDPKDEHQKFKVDGKLVVMMIHISREIWFHANKIDCLNGVGNMLKRLFNKVNES